VSVVDDVERGRLVVELDGRQIGLLRISDVDGGLVMPILARSKPWFEFTPMAGTVQLAIVPAVRRMLFLCRDGESQGEGAADEGRKDLAPMMHIGSHGMRLDFAAAFATV